MPRGIIVARWDDRLGVTPEGSYPEGVGDLFGHDDLLTIFSTHAMTEKAGILAMRIKRLNIVSYYSGLPEDESTDQFFVTVILEQEEDPSSFDERLTEIAKLIISSVSKPNFENLFGQFYDQLIKMESITEEQRYAFIFRDNVRQHLLQKLTNGPMTKEGLAKWLTKEIDEEVTDIDGLLAPLNKTNLIDEENISKGKKISLEYVFLTRDVAVIRIPNVDIFKAAKAGQMPIDIREKYIEEVEKFFQTYRISSEDATILGEIVSNPDFYEIIQVLRNEYCIREELPQKVGREIEGIENILKELAEKKIITAIKDKKQRIWVLLLSDIKFPTFFPEYMIDIIRRRWKEGTIAKEIALKHLEILRAEYIATQAPKYRRKVLKNIIDNFEKAEELIAKEEFDQAATLVDTMASYARDMGERNFGELLAGIGKFIREDKERYIEDKFPADREKVLEYLSILSEKSEEKEVKKKKTPKEVKIKKEEKKKIHSGASQLGKIDGIQTEKAEKERKKKATQDLYKEPEVLNKESEILDDNLLNMSMEDFQKGEVSDSDTTKTEITSDSNDSKKIELQKLIDKANEENDYSLLAQYEGQFSELEKNLGNTKSAEHHKEKQNYYVIQALNMLRTDLEKDGKKAKKNGDFIKAAELFTQCKDISEKLFQSGKMSESESVNKFTNLIEEMNSKSS